MRRPPAGKGARTLNKKFWLEKPPATILDWLCLIFAGAAFYLFLQNLSFFVGGLQTLLGILSPFAGGVVIAFVLDPLVETFHNTLLRGAPKLRWLAILLAYLAALLLLWLLAWLVLPQIGGSFAMLFSSLPGYMEEVRRTLLMVQQDYGLPVQHVLDLLEDSEALMRQAYNLVSSAMPQIVATLGGVASNFVAVFTAVASSIYMLSGKSKLLHQLRTITRAVLPPPVAENVLRLCHFTNENFTGFYVGKVIDSAIIGVLTFVLMSLLGLDFALLISVFVGITNIIPVFGPFIGAIPSLFILLLVDPLQALVFAVLILVIQQLDGNFIGPKILGQSVGISSLWVLFAIVVGGGLFGLPGMVIGVPLFATLYGLLHQAVAALLQRRGIDAEGEPLAAEPRPEDAAEDGDPDREEDAALMH